MIKPINIKTTAGLMLPLLASFLAQKSMQFIDTLMMGWLGSEALAAGALGIPIFFTVLVFCMGALSSVGVFIVRAKGAGNEDDIRVNIQHGICFALSLSIFCMLLVWFLPYTLPFFGEDHIVIKNVILLLHALLWGIPGFLLFSIMREFVSAFSLTPVVMCVTLGSIPLTFGLNYFFIYGGLGLRPLGVAGIGYGGSLVCWFMFFGLWFYSARHPLLKKYATLDCFKISGQRMKELIALGFPSGALLILESGMFLFAAVAMGYFGVEALAAHQIAMQCASIAYTVPLALSMVTALQVGHALGAKNREQAGSLAFTNLSLGLILCLIMAVGFVLGAKQIANIFLFGTEQDYDKILNLSKIFLIIAGFFQCFDGLQSIANGALRGLKDTFIPMILSLVCYWILGVGSAYYFAFYTSAGPKGIWYGFSLGLGSVGIILLIRLLKLLKA